MHVSSLDCMALQSAGSYAFPEEIIVCCPVWVFLISDTSECMSHNLMLCHVFVKMQWFILHAGSMLLWLILSVLLPVLKAGH